MKKAKKFLLNLLAFASVSAFAFGMVACDDTGAQGAKGDKGDTGEQGEQGVGIESVQVDENGNLVITLTDGTVLPAIEFPTDEPIENGATHYLQYQKIVGKDEYRLIGLGLAAESDIVISSTYNGLPVTEIAERVFNDVAHISSVTIPDTVTTIGNSAFAWCENLTSVKIGSSVTTIGSGAFAWCENLTSVTIGDSVTTIGNRAFEDCENLTSVTIPDSVTTIGYSAFQDCENLTSVTIGNSVTEIGEETFYGCRNLTSVYYTGNIVGWCGISGLSALMSQDVDLYINNEKVVDLVVPDDVEKINDYAFAYCDSLTSVTLPDSVMMIGQNAFYGCPDELFTIYENVKYLGNEVNPYYALIETVANTYSSYTIQKQTKVIADYAFAHCDTLTSVTIPDSVTTIGNKAFAYCYNLTSVTIPDSVAAMGECAFYCCRDLTNVVFKDTSTWYRTSSYNNWVNKMNGTQVDVSDTATAADLLKEKRNDTVFDIGYYWYKL
ncbi:MAG: leucine-rich repeat domain-containing protein [Clostridiales bacterium]|nr:leucine-rich repeat domain-containing protein [Clostridiales bacterium]